MEECQCPKHGFCEYYKQEMTYDPPNWQWCQSATPEEREKHKLSCDKKHKREKGEFDKFSNAQYITNTQLIRDCKDLLLPQIADLRIKGILGLPRSGMFPASMIAMWLNLPLYYLDPQNNLLPMSGDTKFGGIRMLDYKPCNGRLLVLDDTVYSGKAMKNIKSKLLEDIYCCAVYVRPESKDVVDFYAKELNHPHLLEWNLFNCTYIKHSLLDFDGILCPNVPLDILDDEEKHKSWLSNVKPFYHRLPKSKCKGIVTARFERYRSITEEWLDKHNVKYDSLTMLPDEMEEQRLKDHVEVSSSYKAKHFIESGARFFIESEIAEAVRIRKKSGKFVICPDEKDG